MRMLTILAMLAAMTAGIAATLPASAYTCTTNCYGYGNSRTCTTTCF